MDDLQQFLSLMDTIHDYGNTTRTTKAILRKEDIDEDDENEVETVSFNKAYLLDFLMLSLVQGKFKDNIGLATQQNYLINRENCKSQKIKGNRLSQNICSRFYFPTYENKIIFRSPKPEGITKDILWASKTFPDTPKSLQTPLSNTYTNDFETILTIYNKNFTKISKTSTPSEVVSKIDTILSTFAQLFNCEKKQLKYIIDANALENQIFDKCKYEGLFNDYDAVIKCKNTQPDNAEVEFEDLEFSQESIDKIEYVLEKKKQELILLNRLGAFTYNTKYGIYYEYNGVNYRINIDENSKDFAQGLSLFVQLINAINEKTLGVQQLRKPSKEKLRNKLEKLGLEILMLRYSIGIDMFVNERKPRGILILNKLDFVMALFDFKRSMDYLYVKACDKVNKKAGSNTKYVFVSSDRSAIFYALNLGCPCILTLPQIKYGDRKGEQDVILYNPDNLNPVGPPPPPLTDAELQTFLKSILDNEKVYEAQDEVDFLINKVKVNQDMIEKQLIILSSKKRKSKEINTEIDRLKKINFDEVYAVLYNLKSHIEMKSKTNVTNVLKTVNTKKSVVDITSPYPPPVQSLSLEETSQEKETSDENKTLKQETENIKRTINLIDIQSEMKKRLTRNACMKWLPSLSEYDKGNWHLPKYPRGFQTSLKTDKQKKIDYMKEFHDYCIKTHGLQDFWDKLVQDQQQESSTGGYAENPGFSTSFQLPVLSDNKEGLFSANSQQAIDELVYFSESPANENIEKMNQILEENISLAYVQQQESKTLFDAFLKAYSTVSPTITFFWFIVFKTVYFHLEKQDKEYNE